MGTTCGSRGTRHCPCHGNQFFPYWPNSQLELSCQLPLPRKDDEITDSSGTCIHYTVSTTTKATTRVPHKTQTHQPTTPTKELAALVYPASSIVYQQAQLLEDAYLVKFHHNSMNSTSFPSIYTYPNSQCCGDGKRQPAAADGDELRRVQATEGQGAPYNNPLIKQLVACL